MNNNLNSSSHAKCYCGRYASIGEWKASIGFYGDYKCPDCLSRELEKQVQEILQNRNKKYGIKKV